MIRPALNNEWSRRKKSMSPSDKFSVLIEAQPQTLTPLQLFAATYYDGNVAELCTAHVNPLALLFAQPCCLDAFSYGRRQS